MADAWAMRKPTNTAMTRPGGTSHSHVRATGRAFDSPMRSTFGGLRAR